MKKKLKYSVFTLLLFALVSTSCKDYIEIPPENTLPVLGIDYTITADSYKPVAGIYSSLNVNMGWWITFAALAIRSDDVEKGSPSPTDQQQLTDLHNFNYVGADNYWLLELSWTGAYQVIIDANLALIALDKYKEAAKQQTDKDQIDQYKGEVRFIRSYSYFVLYRLFGDVPLFTKNGEDAAYKKTKFEDIIKFIENEMDTCYTVLPKVHPKDMPHKGAASAYSALALKAKAAADILDYDAMLSATETIINSDKFDLYPDFINLFNREGRLCEENLFEMQYSNLNQSSGDATNDDAWFDFQGPAQPFSSKKKFNGENLSGGWGFAPPTQKIVDFLTSRNDTTRIKVTIMKVGEVTYGGDTLLATSTPYPTMYNGKAYVPSTQIEDGRNRYGSGNNVRVFRYADILLLNAEAKVGKSQNGDASLNKVRDRVGLPEIINATMEQILDERRAELAMEWGEHYYDLVRTGKAADQLPGWSADKRFYPIPLSQIDLNPNLE
jgi:hypothetical protein